MTNRGEIIDVRVRRRECQTQVGRDLPEVEVRLGFHKVEFKVPKSFATAASGYLVPRRLSFDENVRAKEGGNETTSAVCTLPMVPCGSSPVTRFALASAMRKTKRLRRRLC